MNNKGPSYKFVETSISRRIWDLCKLCRNHIDMAVAYGDPGIGKTVSCKTFSHTHDYCILIEARPNYSPTALLSEICAALQFESYSTDRMFHRLSMHFNENIVPYLLIIDEAEQMSYKAIEMARRLHDIGKIGIILCGTDRLPVNITGNRRKGSDHDYRQIFSRCGFVVKLNSINDDDVNSIVKRELPKCNSNYIKLFADCSKGSARKLHKLIKLSKHLCSLNGMKLDSDIIEKANSVLL